MNNIGPNNTQNDAAQQRNGPSSLRNTLTFSKNASKSESAPNKPTSPVSAENVKLSSQALDLAALEQSIRQAPDMNATRMVNLHARVSAGEYQVNSERLAQRILDFERELDK